MREWNPAAVAKNNAEVLAGRTGKKPPATKEQRHEKPKVAPKKVTGEPPVSAAAAYQIYRVKRALAQEAVRQEVVAWDAYEAIWAREEAVENAETGSA